MDFAFNRFYLNANYLGSITAPFDLRKMPQVEGGHRAAPFQSRRPHNNVVLPNYLASRFQFRPNAGVFIGGLFCVGNHGQRGQNRLKVLLALRPARSRCPRNAMPQLGYGHGPLQIVRLGERPPIAEG
jgi:hypothetical protein